METNKRHSRLVPVCAMFAGASVLMSAMTISTKTVAVYDGAERKLVHTTANDPGIVARAAGLQLSADDDVFFTDDPADGFVHRADRGCSPWWIHRGCFPPPVHCGPPPGAL